jgi:hypothetical protein
MSNISHTWKNTNLPGMMSLFGWFFSKCEPSIDFLQVISWVSRWFKVSRCKGHRFLCFYTNVMKNANHEEVMQVFYLWVSRQKDCLHDLGNFFLPTMHDKWVSLHLNFGLVCWYDDAKIGEQFKHCNGSFFFLCIDVGNYHKKSQVKA